MILVGSQRSGGLKLAAHLTNLIDNDHVEIHELRGFTSETLRFAFQETEAIAKGTQCKQPFFSLSLNPPETEHASTNDFEDAVRKVEERLGLSGHPRAIIFHEKNGRRHAHAVWSRIDVRKMKAVNLSFFKTKLKVLSKDLFLEHNWRLPEGLRDRANRDPKNFDLAEWQQAKRAGKDARQIKRVFQEAWQVSDSGKAFASALEEKGYILARGDRRRYVAIDVQGEVYAIPKWTGLKTKQVREKLGDPEKLPGVEESKKSIEIKMRPAITRWKQELSIKIDALKSEQKKEHTVVVNKQRDFRDALRGMLERRRLEEVRQRQERFREGLKGLWDRLSGRNSQIQRQNEKEAWNCHLRDRAELDALIFMQIEARRELQRKHSQDRAQLVSEAIELRQDRTRFRKMRPQQIKLNQNGPAPGH